MSDPINSRIIIADVVELILLPIVFNIFFHLWPLITPIIIAIAAENNKAIWLGPPKEFSPYM